MPAANTITLAPYTESDRDALIALMKDPMIGKTFIMPDMDTPEDEERMFGKLLAYSHSGDHFERGVYLDGRLIGFVNDVDIKDKSIEIGYVIATGQWGHGYAGKALALAIDELFLHGYERVTACAFEDNKASFRVMEKCGMRRNGEAEIIEFRGKMCRCPYYEIRRTDG